MPRLAAGILRERREQFKHDRNSRVFENYTIAADEIEALKLVHTYVGCFSKSDDDLGQWRAYADDGCGVAIGFELDDIIEENEKRLSGLHRTEVHYDTTQHKRAAEEILREYYPVFGDKNRSRAEVQTSIVLARLKLTRLSVSFKTCEFRAEKEHRLVWSSPAETTLMNSDVKVQFRTGKGTMIPFVEIKAPHSTIKRVMLGPRFGNSESEETLKLFLKMKKFAVPEGFIDRSRAAYRRI